MKNQKTQRTRLLPLVLTVALLFSTLPSTAFATEGDTALATTGLTECHEDHDADCGYKEAMEGTACSHLMKDGSSSCVTEMLDLGTACDHADGCGYTEAVTGADCTHALSCDILSPEESANYAMTGEETGLFAGRFSHYQVFDCARNPPYPEANQSFTVSKFAPPFDDAAGTGVQMSKEKVNGKVFYFKNTTDKEKPFVLWMADNAAGENGVAISRNGNILALGDKGFLFISQGSSKGYFISLIQGFDYGDELTYTPDYGGPISEEIANNVPNINPSPWDPKDSWLVTFDDQDADKPEDGKITIPSQIFVSKSPSPALMGRVPSALKKSDCKFNGWNTKANGTGYPVTSDTVLTANITAYAQWVTKQDTIFEIKTPPKTAYTYGDKFDPTGLVVTVTYSDGSTQDIAYKSDTIKFAFSFDRGTADKLQVGNAQVTITYTDIENGKPFSQYLPITVSKRPLTPPTVTGVGDKVYDGNTSTIGGSITLENVVQGDDVTASGTIAFVDKNVGINKPVDVSDIALDDAGKENYVLSADSLSNAPTAAKITPREATITWEPNPASFTYDGTVKSVTATVSNRLSEDDCTVTVENGSKTLPDTYTATATSISNPNYTLPTTGNTYEFIIEKATITGIVATPTEKVYDGKYENGVTVTGQLSSDVILYSTDNGTTWSNDIPQVGRADSSTNISVKVEREHHNDLILSVVATVVNTTPTVRIEKPVFDAADVTKVRVGGIVTQGKHPIESQTFEYRKIGETNWTPLNTGTVSGNVTAYSQLLENLAENTEYELRLTATDDAKTTATTTLKFRTQVKNTATGGITGSVDGGTGAITVTLEMGNTVVASIQGLKNKDPFSFINLADGEYNVVATDASGKRVTMMASVKDGKTTNLSVMMIGQKQSAVEVKGNTPPVAVDGLQGLFATNTYETDQDAKDAIDGNGTVEIKLTANEAKVQSEIDDIRRVAGSDTISLLIDLKVDMIITPLNDLSTVKNLKEVDGLLTVAVPLPADAIGKANYKLYRHHNGAVETLRQIQNETDKAEGTFRIDGKYAYVYSSKFSTYAIAYNNSTGGSGGSSGSGGGSGSSSSGKGNATVVTPPVVEEPKADTNATGVADWLVTDQHVKYMTGDEKGNFNPTSNMTRAEVAQMFYNLMIDKNVEKTVSFNDVADSAWYAEAVNTLASMNILKGADGNFRPEEGITRGEFAAVAGRFSKMEKGDCAFNDVDENLWSYGAIAATSNYGWISGYEDNTFRPEQQILRAEVVVIVNNMLGRTPDEAYIDANKANLKAFADTTTPSYWAWYHIAEATNAHAHIFDQKEEKWTSLK